MEESTSSNQNDVLEHFSDSSDDFLDCSDSISATSAAATPPEKGLRRRRSIPHGGNRGSGVSVLGNYRKFKERKLEFSRGLMGNEKGIENDLVGLGSIEVKGSGFRGFKEGGNEEKEDFLVVSNENENLIDGDLECLGSIKAKSSGFRGFKEGGNEEKGNFLMIANENGKEIDGDLEGLSGIEAKSSGFKGFNNGGNEEKEELSVVTNENGEESRDSVGIELNDLEDDDLLEGNDSNNRGTEDLNNSVLLFFVNLLIRSITFQISLLIYVVMSPLWLVYKSYMFLIDPFGIMRRGRSYVVGKVIRMLSDFSSSLSPFIYQWLKEHDSVWKLGMKFGWGILWSAYVGIILVGLLLLAFVMGGLVVKGVVKEPLRIKENLNFDYTEKSPVTYVPLAPQPTGDHLVEYKENVQDLGNMGGRRIPPNRKLQVTVSLKLPESDYNRNLGIFQVRVDLLTADGKTLASSRRPCMLRFKSDIIRHASTFLNVAPLLTGYSSESQTINVNFRGFTEGSRPTACLRVIIEQRAEFHPGGGIPEIYAASLALESELPLLKRIMWFWRKTLFVWISMTLFTVELFFALLCCKPLVIPRVKLRENSARHNAPGVNPRVQR
ncbi:hypothetical protein Leryth_010983 [Lithospermum erythrorhizon]|nr:hypothetical protein Leryth_010983 [Lithospermum erythrorhizon]